MNTYKEDIINLINKSNQNGDLVINGTVDSSESIEDICKEYNIKNYTINKDGYIDVDGGVCLYNKNLNKLPLKFGKVSGNFYCYDNQLTSLKGSPKEVGGNFDCSFNKLTSLKGSPDRIGGNFNCYSNKLVSLEGSPNRVGGSFYCSYNELTNLEGAPDRIGGHFDCKYNPIHNIYKLFNDPSKIELFNDYDIIRDNGESIVLDRLNAFLEEIGKDTVDSVKEYRKFQK